MAENADPASVIEEVLRGSVLPGLVTRLREMTDGELALDILDALDAAGFEVVQGSRGGGGMNVIERWHEYVARADPAVLDGLIAEDCVFQSPAVHSAQAGKAITLKYLRAALVVLNGPGFRYLDEWVSADKAVLEFEAEVDGLAVNGVDMIWWNAEGQITRFKVMVRPLKALNALVARMAAELQRAS